MFMFDGKKNIIMAYIQLCVGENRFKKNPFAINAAKVMIREINCR